MRNKLFAYFDINPTVAYPVILGNVYSGQYNEEIDSINILLDKVTDRLNLKPYGFVKIVNKDNTGFKWNNKNYIFMFVDNFVEEETSIFEPKIYNYKINLMNIMKYFEKIQCSNVVITHSLVMVVKQSGII